MAHLWTLATVFGRSAHEHVDRAALVAGTSRCAMQTPMPGPRRSMTMAASELPTYSSFGYGAIHGIVVVGATLMLEESSGTAWRSAHRCRADRGPARRTGRFHLLLQEATMERRALERMVVLDYTAIIGSS